MYDLGYEEYIFGEGVTIIEWANIIEDILPKERLTIDIKREDMDASDKRKINICGEGSRYREIIKELN